MRDGPFPVGMMPCIEEFFESIHPCLEPGKDYYQRVFDTSYFFPLQRQREMVEMMRIARTFNPTTIMEIGADKGGGLYHWCHCLPSVRHVIASEIRGLPYATLFDNTFPHIQFTWVSGSSYEPRNRHYVETSLKLSEHKTIDCLFIDGDKSAFLQDYDTYAPLLSSPSVVFLHDIKDGDGRNIRTPRGTLEHLKSRGLRVDTYINTDDSTEAMVRQSKGLPPESAHEGWLREWNGRSCGIGIVRQP